MTKTIKTTNNIQAYTFAFIAEKIKEGKNWEEIQAALYNDVVESFDAVVARALAKIAVRNFREIVKEKNACR